MHVLIVYAHPEPKSFNGALKAFAVATLRAAGHDVTVSDLYAMRFEGRDGPDDFTGPRLDPDHLHMQREQQHALVQGTLAADIRAEQAKLERADVLLLQFPMYWFAMPAVMKGWIDRVMSFGWGYARGRRYDTGVFRGKRAMLSITTGGPQDVYAGDGLHGHIDTVLWPMQNGILRYLGFDVLPPFLAWSVDRVEAETRGGYFPAFRERLLTLDTTEPLFFHPAEHFDERLRLKPGIAGRTAGQRP